MRKKYLQILLWGTVLSSSWHAEKAFSELSNDSLKKAELFFDSALYVEAIPLFTILLQETEDNDLRLKIALRIVQSYFLLNEDDKLIAFAAPLLEMQVDDKSLQQQFFFLAATAYQRQKKYEQALSVLHKHASLGTTEEGTFEIGKTYFLLNNPQKAQEHLLQAAKAEKKDVQRLAYFYLAQIELTREQPCTALHYLLQIADANEEVNYLIGETYFKLENYEKAIEYLLLSKHKNEKSNALQYLGQSYLHLAAKVPQDKDSLAQHLQKAEQAFTLLAQDFPEEKNRLALAQCYLTMARLLKSEQYFHKTEHLLLKETPLQSQENQAVALLMLAQAAADYKTRNHFFNQVTQSFYQNTSVYIQAWYLRGLNDLEKNPALAGESFQQAWTSIGLKSDQTDDCLHMKGVLASLLLQVTQDPVWLAEAEKAFLAVVNNEGEDVETSALITSSISFRSAARHSSVTPASSAIADAITSSSVVTSETSRSTEILTEEVIKAKAMHALAIVYFQNQKNAEALDLFTKLENKYPHSSLVAEAVYWSARCAENLKLPKEEIKKYYTRVYQDFINSPFAAEAYFRTYSYYDYLQGDRGAIKHLQRFEDLFPNSPFLMNVKYLIGLDFKRDRKTPEGRWIRKRDLTGAIDAFQMVETCFDKFEGKHLLTEEQRRFYLPIRFRAKLERALTNLNVGEESIGAKKKIYLEYALDVFNKLIQALEQPTDLVREELLKDSSFPDILQESWFWMAKTYIASGDDPRAERIFSEILEKYKTGKTTRGYYLAQSWIELGHIAKRRYDFNLALEHFSHAEEACKGKILNTDQMLDLWIQQGLCYRDLDQVDTAMLILSKVVNEDAISPLRLKAMFLRAEIYEMQGRYELARKQLDAMSEKGGEWALKAKEKLEKEYGI